MTLPCSDPRFLDNIKALTEEGTGVVTIRILKIYDDIQEIERTDSVLRCKAQGRLSNGGDAHIEYYLEIDRDGDQFIGYQIGEAIATPTPTASPTPVGTPTFTPTPTPTPEPPLGSRENPVPFGRDVVVTFDEEHIWSFGILSTIPDATSIILAENRFNDAPGDGNQFFLVYIRVKNLGKGSSTVSQAMNFKALGAGGILYTESQHSCQVIPQDLEQHIELFTNGTLEGAVCWNILASDADTLELVLEAAISFNDSRSWFELP